MSNAEYWSSPKSEPEDRTARGPFDESEVSGVRPWIDLGSIKLIPREGLNLRVEVEDGSGRVVAVALDYLGSTLQVQPFSAPRNEGLWHEIRSQITQQVSSQGGTLEEQLGPLGMELVASVPTAGKGVQVVRFLGVDGPRWFLRGVIIGAAATDGDGRAALVDLYRSLVVVRGNTPMPPRELLPLSLPAQAGGYVS
jgi:hypothetical protein